MLGIFLMPFQCTRAQRPRSAVCNGSCNAHMQLPKFRQLNAMEALTSMQGGQRDFQGSFSGACCEYVELMLSLEDHFCLGLGSW